jgi:pantoate--beta-alanine ligase
MNNLKVIETVTDIRKYVQEQKRKGLKLSLVPTMGALHEGHLALINAAQKENDIVIVSIFVNPTQFGPKEDFEAYPRTLHDDLKKIENYNVQCVFSPSVNEMYPKGFSTSVHISGITDILCGAKRTGHFDGVGLIVAKLFMLCLPETAYFGEKDFQQICIVNKLVQDLNIPVSIIPVPTVRDKNGLALSSRNQYLNANEYKVASTLNVTLSKMAQLLNNDKCTINECVTWGRGELENQGFEEIDYLEIRDSTELRLADKVHNNLRIFAAVKLGKARLIDNIPIKKT